MKKMNLILAAALCAGSISLAGYEKYADADKAAWKAYSSKDYKGMQKIFAEAKGLASTGNQKWAAAYGESRAYREMKQWDDAIRILDDFLKTNPEKRCKAEAMFTKGIVLRDKKDVKDSIANFEAALKYPELSENSRNQAYTHLSELYYKNLKQKDKAVKYCKLQEKSKNKTSRFNGFYAEGIYALDSKQYAEALKCFNEAEKNTTNNTHKIRCYYQRGCAFAGLKKTTEAIQDYKKVVELNPNCWQGKAAAKYIKSNSK